MSTLPVLRLARSSFATVGKAWNPDYVIQITARKTILEQSESKGSS
jgi:hypothetical protein